LLTNKIIDGAKAKPKLYKLADAAGLYLVVTPRGVKSFRCNYVQVIDGQKKHKTKTFGQYPDLSLSDARRLNVEFKDFLAGGGADEVYTFDDLKRSWYLHKLPSLKNTKHQQQIVHRLDDFVSPHIGKMQLNAIRRVNLVEVVQRVQSNGTIETAHRVGMHLRQVFDYAVDIGKLEHHPADGLSRVLQTAVALPMACVPVADAGVLLKAIDSFESPVTRIALLMIAHTFVRTNELRFMQWSEIKDKRFWVIPEDRMKGRKGKRKPHVVPLTDSVLSLLDEIRNINGDYDFVFQSQNKRNQPISENAMLDALYSLGYRHKHTVHGFRALASTVLNEQSPFPAVVIERQLAHKETDAVKAAYDRAEHLDQRISLMHWWSSWVDAALKKP
jgi:integrase